VLLEGVQKRSLDNKPQLMGRLTSSRVACFAAVRFRATFRGFVYPASSAPQERRAPSVFAAGDARDRSQRSAPATIRWAGRRSCWSRCVPALMLRPLATSVIESKPRAGTIVRVLLRRNETLTAVVFLPHAPNKVDEKQG